MVAVALVVCAFAVGMSGLLNYFKYRSTTNRLVAERLVVTGKAVENSIQSALELGLQFSEMVTLPGTLERERATDDLIDGIDVFDLDGRMLYSTDRLRANKPIPEAWLVAARRSGDGYWWVEADRDSAAGIPLKNNFDLTIGYLALRYSQDRVQSGLQEVGQQLALVTGIIFAVAAGLSALALIAVIRGLGNDVIAVEQALRAGEASAAFVGGGGVMPGLIARLTISESCGAFGLSVMTEILTELPVASHFFQSICTSCSSFESAGIDTRTSGSAPVTLNGTLSAAVSLIVAGGASGDVGPSIMSIDILM